MLARIPRNKLVVVPRISHTSSAFVFNEDTLLSQSILNGKLTKI